MSRPQEHSKELVEKAKYYLTSFSECGDVVPTVVGLASYMGIGKSTIYDWLKYAKEAEKGHYLHSFSDIVMEISEKQEQILVNKGLQGEFQSKIAGMMLSKHGYFESKDHVHTESTERKKTIKDYYAVLDDEAQPES